MDAARKEKLRIGFHNNSESSLAIRKHAARMQLAIYEIDDIVTELEALSADIDELYNSLDNSPKRLCVRDNARACRVAKEKLRRASNELFLAAFDAKIYVCDY